MKNITAFLLLALFSFKVHAQTVELFDTEDSSKEATPAENIVSETTNTLNTVKETKVLDKQNQSPDFLDNYIDDIETEKKAKNSARSILNQKPQILTLRQNETKTLKRLEEKTKEIQKGLEKKAEESMPAEELKNQNIKKIQETFSPAPLGLYWQTNIDETKKLGFNLQPAERKGYKNVFLVLNPKQKNNTFKEITAIFGLQDKLWCIYAQGQLIDDDSQASHVLDLYHKYYKALADKYGNAQEFFTPYSYEEELIDGEGNTQTIKNVTKQNPLGGRNFLQELQEGKAVLYATFHNEKIGVTLGVSVDGSGKSYISIDYKDFALMESEKQTNLNKATEDI